MKITRKRIQFECLIFASMCLLLLSCHAKKESPNSKEEHIILGNEVFLNQFPPDLKEKRLGLVINQTSALPGGKLLAEALVEKGYNVAAIFSPEHGFRGTVEGGKEVTGEKYRNIKIYSLYGKNKKPIKEQTREVDAFIYDIQDVGARFYTYITTLKYIMEAAAEAEVPVYVLDRPNPVGGLIIEGPLLLPEYETFIGAFPIPVRYALTAGELATMAKGEGWVAKDTELNVVKMKNWDRDSYWKDTGLAWIPPSPNMPSPETALVYPGMGLLEAVNLNEGRGTPHPFLQFGAPWLDVDSIIKTFDKEKPPGIKLETVTFTPVSLPGKSLYPRYKNLVCHGIRLAVLEEDRFLALRFALSFIKSVKTRHPDHLSPNYRRLNIMLGNNLLSEFLQGKTSFNELMSKMEKDERLFAQKRRPYLLY